MSQDLILINKGKIPFSEIAKPYIENPPVGRRGYRYIYTPIAKKEGIPPPVNIITA